MKRIFLVLVSMLTMTLFGCQNGAPATETVCGTWKEVDSYFIKNGDKDHSYFDAAEATTMKIFKDGTMKSEYSCSGGQMTGLFKYEVGENGTFHVWGEEHYEGTDPRWFGGKVDETYTIEELTHNKLVLSSDASYTSGNELYTIYKRK